MSTRGTLWRLESTEIRFWPPQTLLEQLTTLTKHHGSMFYYAVYCGIFSTILTMVFLPWHFYHTMVFVPWYFYHTMVFYHGIFTIPWYFYHRIILHPLLHIYRISLYKKISRFNGYHCVIVGLCFDKYMHDAAIIGKDGRWLSLWCMHLCVVVSPGLTLMLS